MSKINKRAVLIKSVQVRFFFKESINIHARLFGTQSSQQQQQKDVSRTCDSRGQKLYFLNDTLCYHWGNFVPLIEKSFIHSNLQNHFTKTVLLPWKSSSIVIRFMRGWRNVLLWSHDWHGCMSYLSHGLMTMMMDKRRVSHVIWMAPCWGEEQNLSHRHLLVLLCATSARLDMILSTEIDSSIRTKNL